MISTSECCVFRCLGWPSSGSTVIGWRRSVDGAGTAGKRHVGGRGENEKVGARTTQRYRLTGTHRSAADIICTRQERGACTRGREHGCMWDWSNQLTWSSSERRACHNTPFYSQCTVGERYYSWLSDGYRCLGLCETNSGGSSNVSSVGEGMAMVGPEPSQGGPIAKILSTNLPRLYSVNNVSHIIMTTA